MQAIIYILYLCRNVYTIVKDIGESSLTELKQMHE